MRECAGSKEGFFILKPLSPLQCARLCQLDSFTNPPPSPFWVFLFIFLKWQVFYPTLDKIKYILYIGEDKIGQHFYKKNRLEEHGTVDAYMTSLTESAQG